MEAQCNHNFVANAEDELSFQKSDIVKILNRDEDSNWFKAEKQGKTGYVPANYITVKPHPWYMGSISRLDAERKLMEVLKPDGAFLVRNSESAPGEFSISVKFREGIQHFKILRDGAGKYFIWVVKFNSLNELVEYHRTTSVSRSECIYLKDIPADDQPMFVCQVLFDFDSQDREELQLKKGEQVVVTEKVDSNWWKGKKDGREGLFPASYVKEL